MDGNFVYALGQFGDLVCLDIEKGKEKWRKNFDKDFGGEVGGWNYCRVAADRRRPARLHAGRQKATIVALDKKTGKEIWQLPSGDQAGYSSIVVSNAAGVKQYVQLTAARHGRRRRQGRQAAVALQEVGQQHRQRPHADRPRRSGLHGGRLRQGRCAA